MQSGSAENCSSNQPYCSTHVIAGRINAHRTATTSAAGVISQMAEKARRSTPERRLQMSSVSGLGSMSMRRCTR